MARWSLGAFAVVLVGFAFTRSVPLAFVLAPILGFAYFVVITSLSTVLQEHLDDAIRGRIMALWIMSFGGTVPLGVLAGGFLVNAGLSITGVLVMGAVVAAAARVVLRSRRGRCTWAVRIITPDPGMNRIKRTTSDAESIHRSCGREAL